MKLIFLGSGSAFTVGEGNYHSNILISDEKGSNLLIDCGGDTRHALSDLGLSYRDISHVYISHLHADHTGGLEWLGFTNYFDEKCKKPQLFINEELAQKLWDNVLSGGMASLQGRQANLDTYFKVNRIKPNESFAFSGIDFHLVQVVHYMDRNILALSFGLFFKVNHQQIFITTDTQFVPHLMDPYYQNADLIFHDCQTTPISPGVHAQYQELATLLPEIRKKIWLYHFDVANKFDAIADGFAGFVAKGQVFDLN